MKIIITESQYKMLIKESGIRDINNLAKRYKKAKIYFHQDLDGVTTQKSCQIDLITVLMAFLTIISFCMEY